MVAGCGTIGVLAGSRRFAKHGVGVVLRRGGERLTLANAHMPTSSAAANNDNEWMHEAAVLRVWVEGARDLRRQGAILLAGDWSICLDTVMNGKDEGLEDFQQACRLSAPLQREPTHEWTHIMALRRAFATLIVDARS